MGRRGSRLPSPTIQQGNERVGDGVQFSVVDPLSKVNLRSLQPVMPSLVVRGGAGERIDPIVFGVSAVALYPMPFYPVRRARVDQLLPKLSILDRLLVRRAPAVALPVVNPSRDSVTDVDAIGVQLHPTRPLQRLEALDRGHQLHAIIGGQRLAARELALLRTHAQQHAPAARSGVAAARAVGEQLDFRQLGQGAARAAA